MKAIVRDRYGSADVLRVDEIETPVPGAGEVLVRVHAASVNTADIDQMRGVPRLARIGTGLTRPRHRVPGLDVAGRVVGVGESVSSLRPGDGVWADMFSSGAGAFSEYVCAPETAFVPMPPALSFAQAATVPHSAVLALQGLGGTRRIGPGMSVLINGAGGCVGPFAIQIAKTLGAEVTAVDHTGKLDMMRSLGADHVIDYTVEDYTRGTRRYDYILDIAANRWLFAPRRVLAPGGRYALIARNLRGFFGAALVGGLLSLTSSKTMGIFMWEPNRRSDLDYLGGLIASGKMTPLIDRTYPLAEVGEAVRYQEAGHARGKLVIRMAEDGS